MSIDLQSVVITFEHSENTERKQVIFFYKKGEHRKNKKTRYCPKKDANNPYKT